MELQRTPLYENCKKAGGRMTPFAGWEMPIQFSGLIEEHNAVRKKAGIFDISHMGIISLKGTNPKDALQKLVPTDLHRIGPGECCYTLFLNHNGGILDDLIVYDLGPNNDNEETLLLIVNAACMNSDMQWILDNIDQDKITISDAKQNSILLAVQGPQSIFYLNKVLEESLDLIPRFGHKSFKSKKSSLNNSKSIFLSRTGYTGEEGFELFVDEITGKQIWELLLEEGVLPCGLGARDTLRLEAAMHLYGNDMNSITSPFEAGLGWLIHLEMPTNFIGRQALEEEAQKGTKKRLVGLELSNRAIARKNYQVFNKDLCIGTVSSGSWSPTLQKGIALAYVPVELSKEGTELNVEIRGTQHPAKIIKKPFYKRF